MQQPYQLILDIWEGNPDINPDICKQNGVIGLIVRLNDMRGGHHMDDQFAKHWAMAKKFPISSLYFVYNPWVNGKANYDWFIAHMPSDYGKRRVFIDIEVRYPGYSPVVYGAEVADFMGRVRKHYPATRYSGGGFLDILNSWPVFEDYWWAAYSTALTKSPNWSEYKKVLSWISYSNFTKLSPGPCRLWQASGDGVKLEGFGNHAVDINVFPGTIADAFKWFGSEPAEVVTEPVVKEEAQNNMSMPIGLFTRTAGWTAVNPNYNFVAGAAQAENTVDPNPEIKPIELEAAKNAIPFLLWLEHLPWAYSEQQWGEMNWPSVDADYIFQNFKAIMAARSYQAVVVSVNTFLDKAKKVENPAFVAYSALRLMNRVADWLKVNRPNVPLMLASSDDFMTKYAPNMKNWAHNFYSMATDTAVISKSYPVAGAKPKYLGTRTECEWWHYYTLANSGLIVFRGANGYPSTVEGMKKWLNYNVSGPVVPPTNNQPPVDDLALKELANRLAVVEARLSVVEAALKKPLLG